MLLVLLFSSVAMFSQNAVAVQEITAPANEMVSTDATAASATTTVTESNASMNMVSWFMGTKQTPNANAQSATSTKKQMINSGIAPNRLLMKAFLKKAASYQSTIA